MQTFLLILHLFITLALIGVVLMQRSEGGALGGLGGGAGGFMTARGAANFLTRATAILATVFILNSLLLASMSGTRTARTAPGSVMETAPTAPTAPAQPQVPTNN